jgi:glyoxylase-like metal-dependent hydrolase (beta-lactamase superfamily II)
MVRRILGPNPGVMTGPGTNTYLVGIDEVAVIDPGVDDAGHLDAILGCGGDRIRWILCTHTHPDHAPGAAALRAATGAEVLAFESRDGLDVDVAIGDKHVIEATEFRLTAVHTPGHASNHLCFHLRQEGLLFSGDHIMQGSTVVIAPPDGDMATYLASLEKVRALRLKAIAPGHGHLIGTPRPSSTSTSRTGSSARPRSSPRSTPATRRSPPSSTASTPAWSTSSCPGPGSRSTPTCASWPRRAGRTARTWTTRTRRGRGEGALSREFAPIGQ